MTSRKLLLIMMIFFTTFTLLGCERTDELDLSKIDSITINFQTNSQSTIESIIINQELIDTIKVDSIDDVELADLDFLIPIKEGYIFDCWYFDEALTKRLTVDSPIVEEYLELFEGENINIDMTLYASYKIDTSIDDGSSHSIVYHLDGGRNSNENPSSFKESDILQLLDPSKDGFSFMGWYLDSEFTEKLSFIPSGFNEDIEIWAKWGNASLLFFSLENGEYTVTGCDDSFEGVLEIPETFNGKPVTKIGDSAFSSNNKITKVILGNNIREIGDSAFWDSDNIASVNIHNNVEIIENSAFENCDSLTEIIIGNNVTSIGSFAFAACDNLATVVLGNSVISIGRNTFVNSPLTSISLNDNLEIIGANSFINCNELTSIIIPLSVHTIGEYAFNNCTNLTIYCQAEYAPNTWDTIWNNSGVPVIWGYDSTDIIDD